ncbi:IclR family transcriptional regulator [Leucobacter ruminantium]|uniref:Helix-turn-helix domain-containing protein n=1 Tax=Leucobacter ruminantium TaxID=1289170 RepID=A0A939M0N4_9MICO|nr:helix-turn-helix domain-containing protein [Leucobacter ruminantium]
MKKSEIDYRKPPYALESVDNALRALHMLRDSGAVRIVDVADRLGVARSTAHRTMAMLVYQGFAVQDDRQRYLAGPALSAPIIASRRNQSLVRTAMPILESLQAEVDEIVNLSIRIGVHARVLATLGDEATGSLGDRRGHVYPAHSSSAGRALLAMEPEKLLERLYRSRNAELTGAALDDVDYAELLAHLSSTRLHGFSVCDQEVQCSIASVAVGVFPGGDATPCSIVLLTSSSRLDALVRDRRKIALLLEARESLRRALEDECADEPF